MLYKKQLLLLFKSSRKDPYDFIFQKEIPEQGIFPDKAEKFKDSLPSYFLISAFHPVSPSGGLPVFPVSLREQRTGGTASDYVHPSDVRSIGSDHLYIFFFPFGREHPQTQSLPLPYQKILRYIRLDNSSNTLIPARLFPEEI